jgi:8-oxo-dGTP diphosphatase
MVVSDATRHGIDPWVQRLGERIAGERLLVQLREKGFDRLKMQHLVSRVLARTGVQRIPVVVNSDCGSFPQGGGVHLTSAALMAVRTRPAASVTGASCHDAAQLDHAAGLGLDYAVLGPVKATASHPEVAPLGWPRFEQLARGRPMPVYAIGGLTRADLPDAKRHGAHGVALLSAAFETGDGPGSR